MNKSDTVIYVGGTFDLFHFGHVRLFKALKSLCKDTTVVVAVNGDVFSRGYKGKSPIMTEYERLEVVQGCKYVDMAFIMESYDKQPFYIERIKPTFIAHGDDWMGDGLLKQLNIDKEFLDKHKIKMFYCEYTKNISTSEIMHRIIHIHGD